MDSLTFDPGVFAGLLAAALVAVALPFALFLWAWRRLGASPKYFGFGALVFVVAQPVLRLSWFIPLGLVLKDRIDADPALKWAYLVFACLTAGLFEETCRYLGYRWLVKPERTWRTGVQYGLGHGGIESVLLVGANLVGSAITYYLITHGQLTLPAAQLGPATQAFSSLTPLTATLGGVERVFALTLHVAFSLIVLRAFTRGRPAVWVTAAILAHAVANLVAVAAAQWLGAARAELVVGLTAALAFWFVVRERRAPAPQPASSATSSAP